LERRREFLRCDRRQRIEIVIGAQNMPLRGGDQIAAGRAELAARQRQLTHRA
jgi:hypothetical protein